MFVYQGDSFEFSYFVDAVWHMVNYTIEIRVCYNWNMSATDDAW